MRKKRRSRKSMPKKREINYDLLRIVSAIAVIVIHVNTGYLSENITNYAWEGVSLTWIIENFLNFLTRFSVPCFIMLSGAFILHSEKTMDYKTFYRKSFYKIGVPFLVIYLLWILLYGAKVLLTGEGGINYLGNIFKGTYGNLWFVPMLLGLYLISPLIVKLKDGKPIPLIMGVILLAWAVVSQSTSEYEISYSIGIVSSYVSYYIMGNILYESKKKIPPILLIMGMIVISIVATWWRCGNHQFYSMEYYRAFFSPLVVIFSILVFIYFKQASVRGKRIDWLAGKTYYVYLLHTPILIVFQRLFARLHMNELIKIFIEIILVTVFSYVASVIYEKMMDCLIINMKKFLGNNIQN